MTGLGAILTAMVTPFDADGRVDEGAAARLARHLVDHGSDGIVVCGSTGEAPTLTDDEQIALISLVVAEVGERASVVAGAGSNDTRHAVELTKRATDAGAHGILSVTPYYNRPNRRGLISHFGEVARATHRPVILYNIPSRTGLDMPNDLLAELAEISNVVAVKQARYEHLAPIEGLDLLAGNDDLLARVLDMGGTGGILVASHLVGPEMRRMVAEPDERAGIEASLLPLYEALAVAPLAASVKAALQMLGHDVGGMRLPLVAASEQECIGIRAALEAQGLLERV